MPKQVQVPVLVTVWVPEGTPGTLIAQATENLILYALEELDRKNRNGNKSFQTPEELLTLSMGLADVEIAK